MEIRLHQCSLFGGWFESRGHALSDQVGDKINGGGAPMQSSPANLARAIRSAVPNGDEIGDRPRSESSCGRFVLVPNKTAPYCPLARDALTMHSLFSTARRLIAQGSADGWFWIHVAQALVFTALAAFAFRRLARVAQGTRATDVGNTALPQVVIVGAGFGGLNAAWALRRAKARVTLIDRRNHHLFQPLLYQVATAGLSPANIAYPIRSIVRRNLNTHVLLDEVLAIDLGARRVTTTRGDVRYDFLIVAAGADNSYFGHDEWAQFAPGLKSLEDALDIRRRILLAFELAEQERDETARRILLTFLVIGGGPTGVELAGAIAEISRQVIVSDFRRIDPREARIVLVEAGPRILPTFDERLAAKAALALSKRGVEVLVGSPVKAVSLDAIQFEKSEIKARTIIWAAGVAASKLAKSMGTALDRAGRVKVQPDLTVEGHPEAFVIGDLAACADASGKMIPGLAPVAIQEGRCAAANIMRALAGQQHRPFKYVDKGALATVGRAFAIAQIGAFKVSGLIGWLIWSLVHITYLVGFRNRVVVMFEWAWAYVTYQRGARLITGDVEKWMAVKEPSRPDDEIRRSGGRV